MPRTASFDPELALDQAMHVFWARGWAQTSIDDVVVATGVNRHSLYARWTDKRGLYLACLDRYLRVVTERWLAPLGDGDDPLGAIRAALHQVRDAVLDDPERRGCLAMNTLLAWRHEPDVFGVIRAVLDDVQAAWRGALVRAVAAGQLPVTTDVDAHAAHLAVAMQALLLQARAAPPPATVHAFVDLTLATLEPR